MEKREWLEEAIKRKGIKKTWLAEKVDISYQHLYTIIKGTKKPSVEIAKAIANEVEVEWIKFFDKGEKSREKRHRYPTN